MRGMRGMRGMLAVLVGVLLLAGCHWPRDASGTLDDVRGGVLRVGITENEPWTVIRDDGTVAGAEVRLVERLAADLGARIEWYPGSESTLMESCRQRVLHLVVGGLESTAPWSKEASLTRPYATVRSVVAVPRGAPEPAELAGVRVAVRAGTAEAAELSSREAVPAPVADESAARGLPVVVDHWQVADLGLTETRHELGTQEHVMAVPLGENGWQTAVERFLLGTSQQEVERLLLAAEAAAP